MSKTNTKVNYASRWKLTGAKITLKPTATEDNNHIAEVGTPSHDYREYLGIFPEELPAQRNDKLRSAIEAILRTKDLSHIIARFLRLGSEGCSASREQIEEMVHEIRKDSTRK